MDSLAHAMSLSVLFQQWSLNAWRQRQRSWASSACACLALRSCCHPPCSGHGLLACPAPAGSRAGRAGGGNARSCGSPRACWAQQPARPAWQRLQPPGAPARKGTALWPLTSGACKWTPGPCVHPRPLAPLHPGPVSAGLEGIEVVAELLDLAHGGCQGSPISVGRAKLAPPNTGAPR